MDTEAQVELQLQFWDAKAKRYIPDESVIDERLGYGARADYVRSIARGRGWRICRADRPLKPPTYRTPRRDGYSRSRDEVIREYMLWAVRSNLPSVTVFRPRGLTDRHRLDALCHELRYEGLVDFVDPDEYFSVEQSDE